jgi:hypothetical protein
MKTNEKGTNSVTDRKKPVLAMLFTIAMLFFSAGATFAHCDTMDGPLIADARKAISQNNVNYVLKWVSAADEKELKDAFRLSMKVRGLSHEAKVLSEKYFFDVLVRIHRTGEGVPFTGVKPSGTPVDEKILAADKAIETGDLSKLEKMVPEDGIPELKELFQNVMALKDYDINNIPSGREYIEAYVRFFKFAEGEEHNEHSPGSSPVHVH